MGNWLVWFLLFGLPFVLGPGGTTEVPKVIAAEIIIALLLIFRIWRGGTFRAGRYWVLAGLLGLVLINSNWWGNGFRLQGGFLSLVLLVWAVLAGENRSGFPDWLPGMSLVGLLVSAWLITDNAAGRSVGTMGDPNTLAAAAVFAWWWAYSAGWRWLALATLAGLAALTQSRSGLTAAAIQSGVVVTGRFFGLRRAAIAGAGALVLSLGLPAIDRGGVWEDRWEIWQTAAAAGAARPVAGWGFGNTETALAETSALLDNRVQYQYVDSAHNLVLDYWVQGGAAGVIILAALMSFVTRNLVRENRKPELVVWAGLLTVLMFNPASIVTLVHFWWIAGRGLSGR